MVPEATRGWPRKLKAAGSNSRESEATRDHLRRTRGNSKQRERHCSVQKHKIESAFFLSPLPVTKMDPVLDAFFRDANDVHLRQLMVPEATRGCPRKLEAAGGNSR